MRVPGFRNSVGKIVWCEDEGHDRVGVVGSDGYCGSLYLTDDFTTGSIRPAT